ncbi:MAG: lipid A export permease/ATP-binding protein MsbA [Rhodospirillaceae bacterium]
MNQDSGPSRSTRYLMNRLWRDAIGNFAGWIVLAVIFMLVMAAATAFSAYLLKPVFDDVFGGTDRTILWVIGGAVIVTFFTKGAANYGQAMVMNHVGLSIIATLQNRLFAHLTRLDLAFFQRHPTGTLVSRFTNDIQQMRVAVSNSITGFGRDAMSLVGLVGVMFYQNLELALIAFFVFPAAIFPIVRLGRRMRKVTAVTQTEIGQFLTILAQTFQGIRMIKSYGMEDYEAKRAGEAVETLRKLSMKTARTQELSRPIMETLAGIGVSVVIIYGGAQVMDGATTTGSFVSFIGALIMAYEPLKRLANLNTSLQQGLAGADRLYALLDTEPAIVDAPDATEHGRVAGEIAFEGVGFAYLPGRPALADVSLRVPAGKTVALVGASGAGKSTLLNLIPRFYDVDAGRITIDGADVRTVTMTSLFRNIALVSQEITLFDDTVAANIAYGRGGATRAEIEDAARHAAAHDFIAALPDGYDTVVGEHGLKLSGGQRQRLAIARAMLKDAPILLLDEATSSLDTESERQVQAALDELMRGRTTVVIAHRLSTVTHADTIFVIDAGRLVEHGAHAELLARGGAYKRLYDLQFAGEGDAGAALAAAAEA